jgi:ABC-type multidrug transport system ATPase subunit/ABC-type transport system involved in cytochrome c biogenesis permease component
MTGLRSEQMTPPTFAHPVRQAAAPDAIRLDGVSKRYGRTRALDEVTLAVPWGTTVAVIGANGAGKSTLLATVAGLCRPSSGTVEVLGRSVERGAGGALLGVLTHQCMLYERLTGRENLELHARLRGIPTSRADSVLDRLALSAVSDDPVGACSHGTRRRLALARALLHDPPVLVLDEPFAGLDPASQERLAWSLEAMGGTRTILFSTHDLARARAADRTVTLEAGRIREIVSSAAPAGRSASTGSARAVPQEATAAPAAQSGPGLLRTSWLMLRKDLTIERRSRATSTSVLLLAILLATVLGMAFEPLAGSPRAVSGVLWVLIAFTTLHGLGRSFDEDFREDALRGLVLTGSDPAGLYLGRVLSTTILLSGVAVAATAAVAILFASPDLIRLLPRLTGVIVLAVVGLAALGGILTVLSRHSPLGETFLPLLFLPLAIPVLLGGVESVAILLESGTLDGDWLRVLTAYAIGMLAASTAIFDYTLEG